MKTGIYIASFLLLFFVSQADTDNSLVLCGPRCLKTVLDHYGISSTIDEICKLSDFDQNFGTTMLGLYNAAIEKGLPAVPVKQDWDEFCSMEKPIIAYINESHFVIIRQCDQNNVTFEDYPRAAITMKKSDFMKIWAGESLVFSDSLKVLMDESRKKRNEYPDAPDISFDQKIKDFGVVEPGSVLTHTFTFTNQGKSDLAIKIRTSCGCTAAVVTNEIIKPGDVGEIVVEYDTKGRQRGLSKQTVHVRSNDPFDKVVALYLKATIKGKIAVVPSTVWLGNTVIGSGVTREVKVLDSGDNMLSVKNLKATNDVRYTILPEIIEDGIRSIPIELTITPEEVGYFEKSIVITTNSSVRPVMFLTITGNAVPPIYSKPSEIFFGELKPNTEINREILIECTANDGIPSLSKVISPTPMVVAKLHKNKTNYSLLTTFKGSHSEVTVQDTLLVISEKSDVPVLKIPFFAKISK